MWKLSSLSLTFTNRGISTRGFVYLLEPILVAIAVILLIALFLPEAETEMNYRLIGLHSQDLAAVAQKSGIIWKGDCEVIEKEIGRLAKVLNPGYTTCFRMYGSRKCGGEYVGVCEMGNGRICSRRSWADSNSSVKIEVCLSY